MPEIVDHVAFLSQEIGPRPAGTEEEQQAALYITEQMQKEAGLSATIEDFNSASNPDLPWIICGALTFIVTLLSLFLPIVAIPAIILTFVSFVLIALEIIGRPIITKLFSRGVSQNVVAKYEPSAVAGSSTRRRKIILVTHYDSGKSQPELSRGIVGILPVLQWVILAAMLFIPLILLIRNVFFLTAVGITATIFTVLTVIALIVVAIPIILGILHMASSYNEGANSSASGAAVLLEVARRVGRGIVGVPGQFGEATVHGEIEARNQRLIPDGAEVDYASPNAYMQPSDDNLAAAKAAVAALTGKSVPGAARSFDIADNLVQVKEPPVKQATEEQLAEQRNETREAFSKEAVPEMVDMSASQGEPVQSFCEKPEEQSEHPPVVSSQDSDNVPDWFKKGQQAAKKEAKKKPANVQRSRYADALAAVEQAAQEEQQQANYNNTEEQLQKFRQEIIEERPPSQTQAKQQAAQAAVAPTLSEAPQGAVQQPPAESIPEPTATNQETTILSPVPEQVPQERTSNRVTVDTFKEVAPYEETFKQDQMPGTPDFIDPLSASASPEPKSQPPIVLPDIGITASNLEPIKEMPKQRAPLAEAENSQEDAAKSLLTMLPSIDLAEEAASEEVAEPEVPAATPSASKVEETKAKPNLKAALPSLSGAIKASQEKKKEKEATTSKASPAHSEPTPRIPPDVSAPIKSGSSGVYVAGATGAFAPVGDELLENVPDDEIYIDDADDSVYEEGFTETGAFAGPGYVEMPKSRVRRIFDRFNFKKKDEEEVSPQEWLDIEEDFDAREVGAARGGWESFKPEDAADGDQDDYDDEYVDDEYIDEDDENTWQGGALSSDRLHVDSIGEAEIDEAVDINSALRNEMQEIYQFKHPEIDTEVWFVAIGSDLAGNAGMKAFVDEHAQELRGAMIINLECLGAGNLTNLDKEGMYKKVSASSRMKRFVRKASQSTGISVSSGSIGWKESSASVALRKGFQAMSLIGMDGNKPAYYAQSDDILSNIDEETLESNAEFIMEMLKGI